MLHRLPSEIRTRLRALFRRDAVERELDDELRFHIEHETEKHVRAGVLRAEAERRARAAFGGVDRIKDDTRDARGVALLESLAQDLRYAGRGLRNRPAFTLGIAITLGLGIGVNAAMFGVIDRLLFRAPDGLRDPDRVHRVYLRSTIAREERIDRNLQYARYRDLDSLSHTIDGVAAFQARTLAVGNGADAEELRVTVVSGSFFRFFDAHAALGRLIGPADDSVPTGAPVTVLGYRYWQTRYGGRRNVIGEQLQVDRGTMTIVGIAPKHFAGIGDGAEPALFVPVTSYAYSMRKARYVESYGWSWIEMIARRRPGATVAEAEADLTHAYRQSWRRQEAASQDGADVAAAQPRVELAPVQLARGPDAGVDARVVRWVGGVALVVLLIACANVANLLLARALSRRREIALRLALGVTRGRLVRQLMAESLLLALFGGVIGLLVAQWGTAWLRRMFLPAGTVVPVIGDARTLLFAGAATLVVALLTALVPAAQSGRLALAAALRGGAREGAYRRSRARTALLVVQAALSVVLLVGAGLFVLSLRNARGYPLGYQPEALLYTSVNRRGTDIQTTDGRSLATRMLAGAREIPGVRGATVVTSVPFWSNEGRGLWVDGIDSVRTRGRFLLQTGSPGYFATMGTRILTGRPFDERDHADAPRVAVVSAGMARALWPGREAVGQCFRIAEPTNPCTTVIGVSEEVRFRALHDAREFSYSVPAAQYVSYLEGEIGGELMVRVAGDPAAVAETLRRRLQRELPGAAYVNVVPLADLVNPSYRAWQFGATMFVAFGLLALVLASVGLYTLIAYDVAQRRQELGVRLALGASTRDVVGLVVTSGVRIVAIGLVIGSAIAFGAGRWMQALLFEQSPRDPAVFASVALVLLLVAAVASIAPALRAARVDPNVALRAD